MHVVLAPGADVVALVRGHAESLVVEIADGEPLGTSLAKAAIGPLALAVAPRRVNAVVVGAGADPEAVTATIAFLEAAVATTGQVLTVQPRMRPQGPSTATTNA